MNALLLAEFGIPYYNNLCVEHPNVNLIEAFSEYEIMKEIDSAEIVFGYLDYARKRGGFGPELIPTGNISEDMDAIRDFYLDIQGKYPQNFGEIRLKEEM